ncbi:hypothetical protein JTB14_017595 [Gonioctena quinquepunctata]|nr:hypothetical protein JTB14_017595 [Gonioctena quinquepunctata]
MRKLCNINGCKLFHHPLLHNDEQISENREAEFVSHYARGNNNEILLRVAPVVSKGPKGIFSTYAPFDEGSTVTSLDEEVAEKIGANGPKDCLRLRWTNSIIIEGTVSERMDINKQNKYLYENYNLPNNAKPEILIGQDNIDLIIVREVIEGNKNLAVISRIWVIYGKVSHRRRLDGEFIFHVCHEGDMELFGMMKK